MGKGVGMMIPWGMSPIGPWNMGPWVGMKSGMKSVAKGSTKGGKGKLTEKIFVGGLPKEPREEAIHSYFSQFGEIKEGSEDDVQREWGVQRVLLHHVREP